MDTIKDNVIEIDSIIRRNAWFDFHLYSYDGYRMIITFSKDLTYYHKLEIIFEDIFYASTFFNELHTDLTKTVIEIPEPKLNKELNLEFEIEEGYQIIIIHTEDYKNDIYIAAKSLSYNTDTVYYYDRKNLANNERLADFVQKEKRTTK